MLRNPKALPGFCLAALYITIDSSPGSRKEDQHWTQLSPATQSSSETDPPALPIPTALSATTPALAAQSFPIQQEFPAQGTSSPLIIRSGILLLLHAPRSLIIIRYCSSSSIHSSILSHTLSRPSSDCSAPPFLPLRLRPLWMMYLLVPRYINYTTLILKCGREIVVVGRKWSFVCTAFVTPI